MKLLLVSPSPPVVVVVGETLNCDFEKATIYESLGFDIETHVPGTAGRPFHRVDFGTKPIRELF